MLRSSELLADLDLLESAYRTLHPGLSRYTTPGQLAQIFGDARHELARDRSVGDAFVVLTRLTAAIRCGHSYPNPENQPEALAKVLFEAPRLPFLFRWIGDTMVVTKDFSQHVPPGTVIEAIEGVPSAQLLATLMPLARADGHNDAKRRAYLGVIGESTHEAFDVLAPLVFPQLARPTLNLRVHTPDGATRTLELPQQSVAARAAAIAGSAAPATEPFWHARMIGAVEYLAMPTWVAYKTTWDWKADLEALVKHLVVDKVPALIIDLRGNEGGNDVGDELIAHLIDRPTAREGFRRKVRFASVPDALRPVLDTWDPSFFTLGVAAHELGDGWRELAPEPGARAIEPRGPRYQGRIIVLVDGANSSATFQFALAVQRTKLGILVGEPTGGNQRGINGGAFFFVRLPNTHLEVDLPLIGTFPDHDAPDAGVTPEFEIAMTAQDLARGRDPQLAKALELAKRP
jgi:hypothetical protein